MPPDSQDQTDDDAGLWQRLRAGDEPSFTRLYRDRAGALLRFAQRLTGSSAVAEDVLQDVFVTIIDQAAAGYDPDRGSLRSYLYGIARHAALRRMRQAVPVEARAPAGQFPVGQRTDDDEQAVRAALAGLDPTFREAVLLVDLEGLSYEEAAGAMGVPVGTVRSRLSRARARLAALLTDETSPTISARKEAR